VHTPPVGRVLALVQQLGGGGVRLRGRSAKLSYMWVVVECDRARRENEWCGVGPESDPLAFLSSHSPPLPFRSLWASTSSPALPPIPFSTHPLSLSLGPGPHSLSHFKNYFSGSTFWIFKKFTKINF
jgi:hypothetical protein